ncbi:glutaredoxin 2 isoform X3 [Narcine bancroftii]|uniref:glutaredoxin 2 isoform X3 n=1 Tax=Narcine bancroftii TaxID=1343680 RepID=UPI003831C99E
MPTGNTTRNLLRIIRADVGGRVVWRMRQRSVLETMCQGVQKYRIRDADAEMLNHVAKNCVVLFSKSFCPYCKKIKILFQEQDINYKAIELDLRKDGTTIQNVLEELTGVRTVPRVFVNGKCIGGATDTFSLHSKGKLMPLVLKCSPPYILDESYSQLH